MKTNLKSHPCVLWTLAVLTTLGFALRAQAQDSLLALGNVSSSGNLAAGSNTVGGVLASVRNAVGNYTVTVTAAGAFTGATVDEFLLQTGIESSSLDDNISYGDIVSVSDDVLTVSIRTSDVESDSSNTNVGTPVDDSFYFLLRRVSSTSTVTVPSTRHLVAVGSVDSTGVLASGFGVNGLAVSSLRANTGNYFITLAKAGAFAADSTQDYLIFMTLLGSGTQDDVVVVDTANAASNDFISFDINVADVQAVGNSNSGVAVNRPFAFEIYSIESFDKVGAPASRLIALQASIDGANGNAFFKNSVFPGGIVTTSRTSAGRYQVQVVSPGAFAGVSPTRYVPVAQLRANIGQEDMVVEALVVVVDANTLRIDIANNDVQHNLGTGEGNPSNGDVYISLLDTAPEFLHDLSISRVGNPATLRGEGIVNGSGAGQTVVLPLSRTIPKRVFFQADNKGNSIDGLRLKGVGVTGPLVSRFFVTTGGRRNVTAKVNAGIVVVEGSRPGETVSVEGRIRYRRANNSPNRQAKLRAFSSMGGRVDAARMVIRPR